MCYKPIMDEVEDYFPNPQPSGPGSKISILHPGCGLGRLVFEFALKGYKSQGNEFAYFMLLSSNFILNQTDRKEQYPIYPFIHCFSNLKTEEQAFKQIMIPDICPSEFEYLNYRRGND
jgi:carnosine N-methyltransferase